MKIAFTIATANYLAQAKTVGDSLLAHNPEYSFFILLLDKIDNLDIAYFKNIKILKIEDIGITYLNEMVDRYSIFELSNALKPYCAYYFLNNSYDSDAVIYFDSDIKVYNTLTKVEDALKNYSIIITPHIYQPPPYDGLSPSENAFLNAGIYNGGFFAVTKSEEAFEFLNWWKERMRTQCLVDLANGLYVDQIWLNFVPLYFKKVKVLHLSGYNVAYWNLHETYVKCINGVYHVNNDNPLVFFHFSGYIFEKPEMISLHQDRYSFDQRKDILPLFEDYLKSIISNNYKEFSLLPCKYVQMKQQSNDNFLPTNTPTGILSALRQKIKRTLNN